MSKKSKKKKPIIPKFWTGLQPALILAGLAFLLYANTLGHDFVLDDDIITRKNSLVQKGFAGIPEIFTHGYLYGFNGMNDQSYRPLVLVNLAIETALFGQKSSVHHFFNVLLYALSCFFLLAFARRLLGKEGMYWAFGACLLFTAHPIHTEVVANIKSRDEILSFLFVILSLDQLIRYAEGREN
ncbi:MAG: hypothetical protein AAF598_12485, partial [Bacteroidota bacterium]